MKPLDFAVLLGAWLVLEALLAMAEKRLFFLPKSALVPTNGRAVEGRL